MRLCRKFSAVALLCAMLTYPFGQRGPNGNELSRPLSYRDNAGERGRERERALFIKALTYYSIRLLPALFYSFAALSFFPSPSTSVFYLPFYSYHISFSLRLSSATLTLLSFLLSASLHLFFPTKASVRPPLCVCLLIHRVPFSLSPPRTDVFAIGDPNQSTILAVSIAGGIVLLIFLVTCFVVSGR